MVFKANDSLFPILSGHIELKSVDDVVTNQIETEFKLSLGKRLWSNQDRIKINTRNKNVSAIIPYKFIYILLFLSKSNQKHCYRTTQMFEIRFNVTPGAFIHQEIMNFSQNIKSTEKWPVNQKLAFSKTSPSSSLYDKAL